eukprot:TRINITY_DN1309_c0_g1_i1.p1 TRINITY_DN1309_c0_g1~~TRINITY_DN1309_c0_g1_i1.p1  ORF type:complete len:557 (+),score=121.00 TRINITY_DN1309_c0_g1_i1:112-1782(+)
MALSLVGSSLQRTLWASASTRRVRHAATVATAATGGMNGAESLVRTLLASGVDTCFANPGTSEMHIVAALDRVPGMRCVLALQENTATGAADGYYRVTGKPACTLLHNGPGLANGLSNLHNARRGNSGIVNVVGDQATYHRPFDPPLTAPTEEWARGVSALVRRPTRPEDVGADAAVAVQVARTPPGQIATLILPSDTAWGQGGVVAAPLPTPARILPAPATVRDVARVLRSKKNVLLLLGGHALREGAQREAHRIAVATGARLMGTTFNGCIQRGQGRLPLAHVPFGVDSALQTLSWVEHLVLVGAPPPVGFFGFPGKPSTLWPPHAQVHILAREEHDSEGALRALADELGAAKISVPSVGSRPELPGKDAELTPQTVGRLLAATMPEHAVVVDEAVTFGRTLFHDTHTAPPHDWIQVTGGAIGFGPPAAVGAAVGAPGRRVLALQGDGSAMYTPQALWTQARERLPVTTLLLSNRRYEILVGELSKVCNGAGNPGACGSSMRLLELNDPALGWVKLANGMGVEAAQAHTLGQLADLLRHSYSRNDAPFLIELLL